MPTRDEQFEQWFENGADELEGDADMEDFNEDAWYDPSAESSKDDEDDDTDEDSLGESAGAP